MAWTAMAGKRTFVVPDEHHARALVDAFIAFGFPLVAAGPHDMSKFIPDRDLSGADWTVTVVDEGPYAMDAQGSREWTAVSRSARLLAREHRGYFFVGVEFDVSQLAIVGRVVVILHQTLAHFARRNPDHRVGIRVVSRRTSKNLNPDAALFQLAAAPQQGPFHRMRQQRRIPLAVGKQGAGQQSLQLLPDCGEVWPCGPVCPV